MSSLLQNLLILLGLVLVAALGYYLYTENQLSNLDFGSGSLSSTAAAESADFLRRLNELKQVQLDTSIFSDPRFQSLRVNEPPLIESPVGRTNPFLEVE